MGNRVVNDSHTANDQRIGKPFNWSSLLCLMLEQQELFLTFNLLAFLFHTVLEINDEKYSLLCNELPTRKTFFDDIRALTRYLYFPSWDALLSFMLRGLKIEVPDTS
ncbi:hypothetical protein DSCO28_00870 [Desulfosarcina ovata subsp. sediminis]|uniref:Uncharacterized protein n=1 Tax=Desulfosarcina ovata subsp. sediminis TaxID=885957 RepID=A0A5K7ZF29_9BACT|nr:hypothetical protein DSCO28_00870 [Desulfosarcina ovata subsp. sediminis]